MKKKYYYKIVNQNNRSINQSEKYGGIIYELNKWVMPVKGNGPLCVFDNLKNVEIFLILENIFNDTDHEKIFKCEIKKSIKNKVWNNYKNIIYSDTTYLNQLPMGTILADKVMLIEEIELNKKK